MNTNTTAETASTAQQEIDLAYDDHMIGLSRDEIEAGLQTLLSLPQPSRAALVRGFRAALEGFLDTHAKQIEEGTYLNVLRYYLPGCLDEAIKQVVVERYLGVTSNRPAEPEIVSTQARGAAE